jgi:hypothetical protein
VKVSVAVLRAFIDDSGSDRNSPWYVLAGYIGTIEGWGRFDAQWSRVLHQDPRVEYFKSSEAESLRPDWQWAGVSVGQRNEKVDALIEVIRSCARRPVCVRIRRAFYDTLVRGNVPAAWDSPYYFLSTIIVGAAINIEMFDGDGDDIDFVLDKDQVHERGFALIAPRVFGMQSVNEKLVNIARQDEKRCIPLQAADLLAWQIRRFLSSEEPRRRHFEACQDLQKPLHTFILDRPKIINIMRDMNESAARIAPSLGRSPDIRTWR